ncbi:hypothetical protein COO60DRAFT_245287 [Scenedesmus sp. NREL 46B-D3]|nr:hypothetical protein COO60DRAFT_245287 [Scenedesmus sp. NREL 46B-D3]
MYCKCGECVLELLARLPLVCCCNACVADGGGSCIRLPASMQSEHAHSGRLAGGGMNIWLSMLGHVSSALPGAVCMLFLSWRAAEQGYKDLQCTSSKRWLTAGYNCHNCAAEMQIRYCFSSSYVVVDHSLPGSLVAALPSSLVAAVGKYLQRTPGLLLAGASLVEVCNTGDMLCLAVPWTEVHHHYEAGCLVVCQVLQGVTARVGWDESSFTASHPWCGQGACCWLLFVVLELAYIHP